MANTDDLYKLSFGQHGSSFSDNGSEVTPPSGMGPTPGELQAQEEKGRTRK